MSVAKKFGASYNDIKERIKYRTLSIEFDTIKFDLKVRIPLKREMEEILTDITSPKAEAVAVIYEKLSKPILDSIKEGGDEFLKTVNAEKQFITVLDEDIILDGTSIKQVATMTAMWEIRVEKYFHLLQSETGEPINESFSEISEEFPESLIKQIVETIEQTVKPDYKTTKKN
jgi:hypothetical protein